jgi:AcrB/AcrD/AcrF family
VSRANSSTPVGTLNGLKQDISLQDSGQMDKAIDYRQVVAWHNGSPVKLDEVVKIYDSVENDKIATWLNDDCAIVLAIQKHRMPTRRRRGWRAGEAAGAARANSSVGFHQRNDGPLHFNPAGGERRRGNAADRDRPCDHGDLPVSAFCVCDLSFRRWRCRSRCWVPARSCTCWIIPSTT